MSVQGHNIRVGKVEIYAEEQGTGSPTLVFLHYWGGSRRTWSEVIGRLSDRFRLQVTEDSLGGAEGAKSAWVAQGMPLDISKPAAAITVPVCVIVGSVDQVEKEAALREAILPLVPQAKFEVIGDVGHLSPLEGPSEVAQAIFNFVADFPP